MIIQCISENAIPALLFMKTDFLQENSMQKSSGA